MREGKERGVNREGREDEKVKRGVEVVGGVATAW